MLGQVGLRDPHAAPTIHSSLAVFTAILIARHCFTLPEFLKCVALPSLVEAWNSGKFKINTVYSKYIVTFRFLLVINFLT